MTRVNWNDKTINLLSVMCFTLDEIPEFSKYSAKDSIAEHFRDTKRIGCFTTKRFLIKGMILFY